jgi:adenine-specific DNA-methyltransferase
VNYIGSKKKLFSFLKEIILFKSKDKNIFCDLFAGTGYVGANLKPYFNKIISNDFEYYSYVLNRHYVGNNITFSEKEFSLINSIPPKEGIIYNNYCSPSGRLYFSDFNGKKIDAIREYIKKYDGDYYYFLLTCLLEAVDKVQNTTGIYAAFLKKIKKSALKEIKLNPIYMKIISGQENEVYNKDAKDLILEISGDVLYLDPPYNRRQYGSNYHILNTIAKYDMPKKITEITGLPQDYNKSKMCYKKSAYDFLEYILSNANFKDIFLSYNNEGILNKNEIIELLEKFGKIDIYQINYKSYKSDSNRNYNSEKIIEYLFYLSKVK